MAGTRSRVQGPGLCSPVQVRNLTAHLFCCDFLFQVQISTASICSVNLTKIRSGSDFAVVTVTSDHELCDFSLVTEGETRIRSADCESHGETRTTFICHIKGLRPGTLYHLTVVSQRDRRRSSSLVRTGMSHMEFADCPCINVRTTEKLFIL